MSNLYVTNKFKMFRESRGWTQKQMADWLLLQLETNVSVSLIQKWEAGERSISPDMAVEITRLLKMGTEELFERR